MGYVITPANVIGALIGAGLGALIGTAIANHFELTGWARGICIGGSSLLVGIAGWFAGPAILSVLKPVVVKAIAAGTLVINKANQWIADALGIVTQKAAQVVPGFQNLFDKTAKHIFSADHMSGGIMKLGSSQIDIFNKLINVTNQYTSKFATGSNEIRTIINGTQTTIRFFVEKGKIININAFVGYSDRVVGTLLK